MSLPRDFDHDERIQETLQELCLAEFAQYYCGECASGRGCCVDDLADHEREHSPCHSEPEETKEVMREPDDMGKSEESSKKGKVRRQKLTIDLSNDADLSDGEILRRLLSPLGSPLSDEPLEVILEIVGEEDEDDEIDYEAPTTKKSFKSLRERLREVTGGFSNRDHSKNRFRHEPKKVMHDLQYSSNDAVGHPTGKSYSSVKMCPSFQKANSLINEIEKCFTETACLVEKTLEASNYPRNSELKLEGINPPTQENNYPKSGTTDQLTQTIEEALQIFDSIMSESKNQGKSEQEKENDDQIKPKTDLHIDNLQRYSPSSGDVQNNTDIKESNENWYSQNTRRPKTTNSNQNKFNIKNWTSGFEREIDELFKECYAMSSIEPSTSLGSCLKNLESLCFQLNKAKENILLEMKEEYNKKLEAYEESFDSNASQTSSLDSQECLSFINELIEKKLKDKLKQKKFSLDPPLMGLEGRTHKIIAEVLPLKLISENERHNNKENGYYQNNYKSNDSKKQDSAYSSNNTVNMSSGENDIYSESNSEMSTTTNTLDSNRCASYSPQAASDRSEDPFKYSLSETSEEEQSSYMSYEETLALYEDNQELQKSLLSILHSLNDIHDNFLNRRRMEIAMSQKSSSFLHNHLKAEIYSSLPKGNGLQSGNFSNRSFGSVDSYTRELNPEDKRNLSSKFNEDFESIEKIIRVSDELKNLWLYGTDDLRLRNRKPSRSVSFNRGIKRYKRVSKRYEDPNSDEFDYASKINEKSLSMPNLSNLSNGGQDSLALYPDRSSGQSSTSFQNSALRDQNQDNFIGKNLTKQRNNENAECYDVTLNFLQRIMNACAIADQNEDERCDFLQPDHIHPYKAYLRTCS